MEDGKELDSALLMDAAFQIIDASLDTKALFYETCQLSKRLQEDSVTVSMTDLLSVTCTQMQEKEDQMSDKSMLSTPVLAQEVIRLAEKCQEGQSLCQDRWNICLSLISESLRRGVFISSLFTSWISKRGLAIEFLWDLHKVGAYNFELHLASKLKEPKYRTHLSQMLINLCQSEGEGEDDSTILRRERILTGVTNLLINKSSIDDQDSRAKDSKMYLIVLDMLLEGLILLSVSSKKQCYTSPFSNMDNEDVNKTAKKKFVRHALSYCLQHHADFIISEHTPSVMDYKPNDIDKFLELVIKQLLQCLNPQESIDVLNRCLKCDQLNSRTIKAFFAALLALHERSCKVIGDYIKAMVTSGLHDSDASQTTSGLYIARICCGLNTARFPSYRDWYQQTFGEASTSIASTRTSFAFLIKCLTQWVPEDCPEYLKTHILRRPFIPARMRDAYESYLLLAKTRLDDLKIPIRDTPNQDSTSDTIPSKEQQMTQMQEEVDRCVKAYEETGKIPTTILEASIFRKPYFVGKFLPVLLKPRCLPDRPDSRMRLIEEIRKSGRISSTSYNTYKEGCEREKQNLLEGVFDIDDEGDDMLMSPIEQLQFRLDRLSDDFKQGDEKKVCESLSLVDERVHVLVMNQTKLKGQDEDCIEINLCKPIDHLHEQILIKFISCLSRIFKDSHDSTSKKQQVLLWLDSLLAVLLRFPVLKKALITYILSCIKKTTIPKDSSPNCLSIITISIISRSRHLFLQVTDENGVLHDWNNLIEACDHFLSCCSEEEVTFALRFYMAYLYYGKHHLDINDVHLENTDVVEISENHLSELQLLPSLVVKKITLLCLRCRLMSGSLDTLSQSNLISLHKAVSEYVFLLESDWWKRLILTHLLTLEDWIKFELRIDPSRDILAKRLRMSYFWEASGQFIQDLGVDAVCTTIFHLLAGGITLFERKQSLISRDNSFRDLISLLKGLLLQLHSGNGDNEGKPLWLLCAIISCQDKAVRSRMVSLSLHLHPHLIVCDSKNSQTLTNDIMIQSVMQLIDLFAESDLNYGGYFPLDVIIFMIQACDCFQHSSNSLMKFVFHPAIFTSIMVHHESLKQLGILLSLPATLRSLFNQAINGIQRLKGHTESEPMEDNDMEDWMKASALFGFFINEDKPVTARDSISNFLSQQTQCLPFLCELITIWFTRNMDCIQVNSQVKMIYQILLLRHSDIVISSLRLQPSSLLKEFRQHLGIQQDLDDIWLFSILRQCSAVSVNDIPLNVCNVLAGQVISAYTTLLQRMENSQDVCSKVSVDDLSTFSSWLQSLVNSCHASNLYNLDLNILHTCDPLLYRSIYLKTLKS